MMAKPNACVPPAPPETHSSTKHIEEGPIMTVENKRYRVGMDSGGTFTDIVVLDLKLKSWRLYKIASKHHNPTEILHQAFEKAAAGEDLSIADFIPQIEMLVIGTTVATNALLQHRGAKVGLITTKGHEDSLEIREGHKEDGHRYDWDLTQAQILVPRSLRMPVDERVLSDGSVLKALDENEVGTIVETFKREKVETVAISYLWSFLNPDHEKRTAEYVRKHLPGIPVTASHELLPMIGEYNRVSTVVLNAYVQPAVGRFVGGMESALADIGFDAPVRYFQANGGMSSADTLVPKAIYALNSGPAAAPTAGSIYSRAYGRDAITIDAGGTSLDIGLVRGSTTDMSLTCDVARYRIGIPMVNIETLGAGGGSIAWFDDRSILSVGPQSAESWPGPACYMRGGTKPTVTDALVQLGWFNNEALLGGEMPIDAAASTVAITTHVAEPGEISVDQAADGIIRVAVNNMVGGIRRVSIERGYDTRDAVLVGIGGSGPAFACWVAEELEMSTVVIPRVASGFCAFGAALSEVKNDSVATYTTALESLDLDRLNTILSELEESGIADLEAEGFTRDALEIRRAFEMRYHDQVHNCLVEFGVGGKLEPEALGEIRRLFDARHEQLFTYSEPDNRAVLVNIHVSVVGNSMADREEDIFVPANREEKASGTGVARREVYLGRHGERRSAPVVSVIDVENEGGVTGPAIIEEKTTTVIIPEGWSAKLVEGHYEIVRSPVRISKADSEIIAVPVQEGVLAE
jgi:N-methylhydantoinase A